MEEVEDWALPGTPAMLVPGESDILPPVAPPRSWSESVARFATLYVGADDFDLGEEDNSVIDFDELTRLEKAQLLGFKAAAAIVDTGIAYGLIKLAEKGPAFAPIQTIAESLLAVGVAAYGLRKVFSQVAQNFAYRRAFVAPLVAMAVGSFVALDTPITTGAYSRSYSPDVGKQVAASCLGKGETKSFTDSEGNTASVRITRILTNFGEKTERADEPDDVRPPRVERRFDETFERPSIWSYSKPVRATIDVYSGRVSPHCNEKWSASLR